MQAESRPSLKLKGPVTVLGVCDAPQRHPHSGQAPNHPHLRNTVGYPPEGLGGLHEIISVHTLDIQEVLSECRPTVIRQARILGEESQAERC